jgi:hypothetical protein
MTTICMFSGQQQMSFPGSPCPCISLQEGWQRGWDISFNGVSQRGIGPRIRFLNGFSNLGTEPLNQVNQVAMQRNIDAIGDADDQHWIGRSQRLQMLKNFTGLLVSRRRGNQLQLRLDASLSVQPVAFILFFLWPVHSGKAKDLGLSCRGRWGPEETRSEGQETHEPKQT